MTRAALVLLSAAFIPLAACAQVSPPVDSLALARQFTLWLYDGQADSLVAHSTADAREEFATVERFQTGAEEIMNNAGMELEVIEETWKLRSGDCQYWRTARFSDIGEPVLVRWVLSPQGEIEGLGLSLLSQAPPVESETCPG